MTRGISIGGVVPPPTVCMERDSSFPVESGSAGAMHFWATRSSLSLRSCQIRMLLRRPTDRSDNMFSFSIVVAIDINFLNLHLQSFWSCDFRPQR